MDDDFIDVTEDESDDFTIRNDLKEIFKPYSDIEKLESLKLEKIMTIFGCINEDERNIFKKTNSEILRKHIFKHYKFLPINVFIYILYMKNIIIFEQILYHKLKSLYILKQSSIKNKNNEFCDKLNISHIYRKTQRMSKFLNGYYFIISSNNDELFINTKSFEYFTFICSIKKFLKYRSKEYDIINPYIFFFENLYIFNKIMCIIQNKLQKYLNLNFLRYDKIVCKIVSVKFYNYVNELITKKYVNKIYNLIN